MIMKKTLSALLMLLVSIVANANGTKIGDLYYILHSADMTASVTYKQYPVGGYEAYSGLTSATIPSTVTYEGVTYTVTGVSVHAFQNSKNLKEVIIPPTVTTIEREAFYQCTGLLKCAYPSSISNPFANNGLAIPYPKNGIVIDGKIYDKDLTKLFFVSQFFEGTLDIPSSVTTIGEYACFLCNNISEVFIAGGTTSIREGAFSDCPGIKNLYLQPGEGLITINNTAFANNKIQKLFLGRDVNQPLGLGSSLQTLEIDYAVTTLPDNAFSGCTNLAEVVMPNPKFGDANLKTIGNNAFLNCSKLPEILFPNTVETIGTAAFKGCSLLKTVGLSTKQSIISDETFSGCKQLTDITLPNGTTSIGVSAFYNCSSLPTINLPEGITTIGNNAFQGCGTIDNITLPGRLNSIGNYSFSGCQSLSQISIPDAVKTMGSYAFNGCSSLASVVISKGLTSISNYTFNGCETLTAVIIPEGVTEIGNYCFAGCTSLKEVTTSPVLKTIGTNAFNNCDLEAIMLPATVTNIGGGAFDGNANLMEVYTLNTNPPVCATQTSFSNETKASAKLFIPGTAYSLYKSSFCWKDFTLDNFEPLTAIESIQIDAPADRLRINKTMELSAILAPENSTFTEVAWSSSNPNVATVSDDGTVTALSAGYTVITAKSKSLFAIEGTLELQVIDFLIGDSNDSDYVTVTDAVNIASYVMGNEPEVFNFDASDVNESGDITLADASGVITIVLNDLPEETDNQTLSTKGMGRANVYDGLLVANDFGFNGSESAAVSVNVNAGRRYIAMQADVTALGDLEIDDIVASGDILNTHLFLTKRISNNTVRVVIYSPAMTAIDCERLFDVVVSGNPGFDAGINISNILATDEILNEYSLGFEGGDYNEGTTAIDNVVNGGCTVTSGKGFVTVADATGASINVFNVAGVAVASVKDAKDIETFNLSAGIYVVTVDSVAKKIIVK